MIFILSVDIPIWENRSMDYVRSWKISFIWIQSRERYIFSVAGVVTGSKHFYMKTMASYYYIKDWRPPREDTAGQEIKMKYSRSPGDSSTGWCQVWRSSSQKRSDRENLRMKKSKKSPILLGILPFLWYNENSKKRSFIPWVQAEMISGWSSWRIRSHN